MIDGLEATPHTRGSTVRLGLVEEKGNGYPAYAGIDLSPTALITACFRLPRIRGDRPRLNPTGAV